VRPLYRFFAYYNKKEEGKKKQTLRNERPSSHSRFLSHSLSSSDDEVYIFP
jgi:hypothetical protein